MVNEYNFQIKYYIYGTTNQNPESKFFKLTLVYIINQTVYFILEIF